MPVYLYRNLTTGETFEVEQRITEPALSAHPTTGDPVKRLVQPVGIAFKGSGFYVTDSRSGGSKAARPDGGGSTEGAATGSDSAAASSDKAGGGEKAAGAEKPGTAGSGSSADAGSGTSKTSPPAAATTSKGAVPARD